MAETQDSKQPDATKGAEAEGANGGIATSLVTYPAHSLEEGVRFAAAVLKAGGNEAREEDVMRALNLTSRTSRAWSYRLSTAREFGLVDRVGRADDARIKVTDLFKRINLPDGEPELKAALFKALNTPEVYPKLIARYQGAPMPEVTGVANVLVRDYGILGSVAETAAQAFLDSLRYANVVTANNTVMAAPGQPAPLKPDPSGQTLENAGKPPAIEDKGADAGVVPKGFIVHQFQLRKDLKVTIPLPVDLTQADVKRLSRWMETLPLDDGAALVT